MTLKLNNFKIANLALQWARIE